MDQVVNCRPILNAFSFPINVTSLHVCICANYCIGPISTRISDCTEIFCVRIKDTIFKCTKLVIATVAIGSHFCFGEICKEQCFIKISLWGGSPGQVVMGGGSCL